MHDTNPFTPRQGELSPLPVLIQRVRESNKRAIAAGNATLEHARDTGDALNEAKKIVGHGRFQKWVADNFPEFSYRTALNYMKVADRWPALEARRENGSALQISSVRGALEFIAQEADENHGAEADGKSSVNDVPFHERVHLIEGRPFTPEERRGFLLRWSDERDRWFSIYHAADHSDAEIAAFFGWSEEEVSDLRLRLFAPDIPRYPELGDREDDFRVEVARHVRLLTAHVFDDATKAASRCGYSKAVVRRLRSMAQMALAAVPQTRFTRERGLQFSLSAILLTHDHWSRVAWVMASGELRSILNIRHDSRPFTAKWDEADEACRKAWAN
jgi:Protein of unknown function (DUF3102)